MDVITFQGDAAAALGKVMAGLADASELMRQLGVVAMDSQKKDIEESRSPDGSPYPPLKKQRGPVGLGRAIHDDFGEVVRREVIQHPYGSQPLLDTTNMYQSIHYEERGQVAPQAWEVFAGPSLDQAPYFPYQNQGTRRGIPPRVFIGLRDDDRTTIADYIYSHARAALP